jgi:predicted CopG family antitoxin
MATKTISVDLVAYERLKNARLGPRDSFSQVIRRAKWDEQQRNCGALLAALSSMLAADDEVIRNLEEAQSQDAPPDDPWARP